MNTKRLIQGSDEWLAARLGKVTASELHNVMMEPSKSGYQNYIAALVAERLTGQGSDFFKSKAMQRGNEKEPDARERYMLETCNIVEEFGLIQHPTIQGFAASPDGLVGSNGGIEIKCPNTATHIETITNGKINPDYVWQMHAQMACIGLQWVDFVSFDDRLPDNAAYYCKRFYRDESVITKIETAVSMFLAEVERKYQALKKYVA